MGVNLVFVIRNDPQEMGRKEGAAMQLFSQAVCL